MQGYAAWYVSKQGRGGGVPGLGRAYFEVPHLPAADRYAVSVWDYTFLESDGRGALR